MNGELAHSDAMAREAIVAACRRLHSRGLIAGAEGNVSVRLQDGDVLITPAGADKATLVPSMLIRLHSDGTDHHDVLAQGDTHQCPSSELGMHLACYAARSDVSAVVHAHPPVATGFASAGLPLPDNVLAEFPAVVGPVALLAYVRPGTPALGEAMQSLVTTHDTVLLGNHGVTTLGSTLDDALQRMESVEQGARILLVARLLGGARELPEGEAELLATLRRTARML